VKRFLAAAVFGTLVIAGSWFVVFPERTLLVLIRNSLAESGLTADLSGFRKGYFFDFRTGSVALRKSDHTVLTARDVFCRLDVSSLLFLKPALRCEGEIAGGRMKGRIGLLGRKGQFTVNIDDARMENIPFFSSAGIVGSGSISGSLHIEKGSGDILFAVSRAHLLPASFGGIKIPLDSFSDGTGALALSGGTLTVTSFSLEGSGIYARLRGTIAGNRLALQMELMPERSFAVPITATVNF
jgi:type II secretion system protein N